MVNTKNSEGYKLIDEYIPAENKTEKLRKAQRARDDEFYTKREDVENVMKLFDEYNIFDDFDFFVCPCDSEESEFVKLLKEWKKPVVFFQDMDKVLEMDGNFLIFTNPPFSKEIKWMDKITEKGLKFFVLSNLLPGKRNLERLISGEIWGFNHGPYSFKHPSGKVRSCPCVWLHNLEKIKNVKSIEEEKEIKYGVEFSTDGIPIMKRLSDYFYFFEIWKKFSEIYVSITYLYTKGFEGWEAVETRSKIINRETGKEEFTKLLIRKQEGYFNENEHKSE